MNESILVIDDEPLILTTIQRALEKTGYSVSTTSNVDVFFGLLSSCGFDLLIIDLHMKGIQPDDLKEGIRQMSPDAKMLVISGSVEGISGKYFLQKPFRIEELREKVRTILDE